MVGVAVTAVVATLPPQVGGVRSGEERHNSGYSGGREEEGVKPDNEVMVEQS